MATITSAANGNWGTTTTWTGSVVPGTADEAVIDNQITLDANYSVGSISPSSTGCLLAGINSAGLANNHQLLVGAGAVTFIAKGINTAV